MTIGDERNGEMLEAVDRSDAAGSIGLVVVIALAMVAAVVSFLFIGREDAEPWVIGLLALLAVMGVFALFAVAAGILQFAGRSGRFDLTKALVDDAAEGTVVVDSSGRVLYANAAYLELAGATSSDDVVPVERLYTSEPDVAEVIYRLAQAARAGRAASEEVRAAGRKGETG
ncbi:MAG: PAS domain-containing protein, partial [Bacteroidales bacterium]|nr:PAS domain-containing protein [Bacteroidales bacterium]